MAIPILEAERITGGDSGEVWVFTSGEYVWAAIQRAKTLSPDKSGYC